MLRLRTNTPSVLDCARDFLRGVMECVKRISMCGFIYFTSKKNSGYEIPKDYLTIEQLPTLKREKPAYMSKEDIKIMFEFREKIVKGVRQRYFRSDTTQFNAGTLPLHMYHNNIVPTCSPIDLFVPNPVAIDNNEPVDVHNNEPVDVHNNEPVDVHNNAQSLHCIYESHDLLAIFFEGQLYIGKVIEPMFELSNSCKVLMFKEQQGLNFHQERVRDISPASICINVAYNYNTRIYGVA